MLDGDMPSDEGTTMPVIEVTKLRKHYGATVAVDEVSFTVDAGEIFGLLGPNGAGKTTTVECVGGLRVPDAGEIRVLGLDPQRDRAALRQRVGMQLQESELPDLIKVWEALDLYSSYYDEPADWRLLLEELGLADKAATLFRELSGGQKQRLSIALALVGNPEVLILDELTTGLDPQARRDTWSLVERIRARGVTVVLVTHLMEEAEFLCDRVAIIAGGRTVAIDTPAGLVARAGTGERITFRPSEPVDAHLLAELPGVTSVSWHQSRLVVTGSGDALPAVTAFLARRQIIAHDLRVQQASLDDAFVELTGRPLQDATNGDTP
jgi:ABC-2 type transport system ATP-binding protein